MRQFVGMTYVVKIVQAFGGVRPMARALRMPHATIHSWSVRGSIPDAHKGKVLGAANILGLRLEKSDFFPSDQTPEDAA
ncbi:carph-isopro domain-containing protein [Paracoccus sp. (in: a-proteobacteria)]|uniref:carph-isopro domain-containing protein n=1 Tax=Paracoccus sp. TaxID=267 RepID=UPI0039174F23